MKVCVVYRTKRLNVLRNYLDDFEGTFSMIANSGDLLVSISVEGNERIVYMGYKNEDWY